MKKDEALAITKQAVSELAEALAAGKSGQLQAYLDLMSSFHKYSFGNCMLIARQQPNATLVAGFHAWKKRRRSVKKGAKGICILAPLIRKQEAGDEDRALVGFRAVHVFDVAQTEGDELPEIIRVAGDPGDKLIRLRQVVRARGIEIVYENDLGGAEGVSKGGTICLLSGLSSAEEFSALSHECAHEWLHHGKDRKAFPKVVRELEAEAVAYVVAKAAGLDNALQQSSDYIQLYSGDKGQLLKSLERIQRTASSILTELEQVETVGERAIA